MAEGVIQSRKDFRESHDYWRIEIEAAQKDREEFEKDGKEAWSRFLDERKGEGPASRLNLYHANVQTERALLYGKTPTVDVGRRFNDSSDDVARVAAEAFERLLNTDIDQDAGGFQGSLRSAVEDWTVPGLGVMWHRYETGETEKVPGQPAKTAPCPVCGGKGTIPQLDGRVAKETGLGYPPCAHCEGSGKAELAPAVPETERRPDEEVCDEHIHWDDFLWGPGRAWPPRWVAKKVHVTRDEAAKRGWKDLSFESKRKGKDSDTPDDIKDAWTRAEVWEIWCKEDRTVYWWNAGCPHIVDQKPDPLQLEDFFCCARPLMANLSTGKLMPKSNYSFAKDLYDEIDVLTARIKRLEDCAKVRWGYDSGTPDLERIFNEAFEGQGIPVKNWNALQEKGGLAHAMEFVPLDQIVKAIDVLDAKRQGKIQLMYQITGMSDVMRGQGRAGKTATEVGVEAQFTSTRSQTAQDELARFASESQSIRAEIISKHYMPETILERSNLQNSASAELAQQAVDLIKSDFWRFRVAVRPESIALPDMATQRQERSEAVQGLGSYFQAMMPLVQLAAAQPGGMGPTMEFVIKTGQWMISGLRGAAEVEEAFDEFAAKVKQLAAQPPPPPQPDPAMQVAQVKAQAEMGKAQATMQQTQLDGQVAQQAHQMKMREMAMKGVADRIKAQTQLAVAAAKPPPGGEA